MKYQIKNINGDVLFEGKYESFRLCVQDAIDKSISLKYANLQYADLQGVDFWNSDLRGVDLRGANLRNVDLRGANLNDTKFVNN